MQILPQAPGSEADDDGGYTRRVREMTTLSNGSRDGDNGTTGSRELEEGLIVDARIQPYRRHHGYLFPRWWFWVIAAPSILPAVFMTAFQTVVWPAAVAKLAGFENKAFVFAACSQVAVVASWFTPAPARLETFIDRVLPAWFTQRFGRRRPFIVAGHLLSTGGNLLLYLAVVGRNEISVLWLGAGLLVTNLGGFFSSPARNGIIPDTIPLEQRASCLNFVTWIASVSTMLGFCVAWLLSEGLLFTDTLVWWINVGMWIVDMPLLLIACNAEASCWSPEHSARFDAELPTPQSPPSGARTGSNNHNRAPDLTESGSLDSTRGCFEPFKSSASFRWYWVWIVIHGFSVMIESSFHYYWLQDCFSPPYRLLDWRVASNVNSAVSMLGLASSLLSIVFGKSESVQARHGLVPDFTLAFAVLAPGTVATARPHWWRERFGGRQTILSMSFLSCFVRPFSYVLFPGNFSLVVLCASLSASLRIARSCLLHHSLLQVQYLPVYMESSSPRANRQSSRLWPCICTCWAGTVYNGIAGSIASAASGAMQLDCLPCDERGRPHAAAEDMSVYTSAMLLPVTGFPLLLGKSVSWFTDHHVAYSWFWMVGGCVGVLGYVILALLVHPQEEKLDGYCQCTRARYRKERDAVRRRRAELLEAHNGSELGTIASHGSAAPMQVAEVGLRRRGGGPPARQSDHPATLVGSSVPIGARLCDALLFGSTAVRVAEVAGQSQQLDDMVAQGSANSTGSISIAGVALD